jgi:hypothetical protein
VIALLLAASCVPACGLNPQPEPPLNAPPSNPIASNAGAAGNAGAGGEGGDTNTTTAGMENDPNAPGVGGGGTGGDLGVGGGLPVNNPDEVRDSDAGAAFSGDSGTFDAGGSVVTQ